MYPLFDLVFEQVKNRKWNDEKDFFSNIWSEMIDITTDKQRKRMSKFYQMKLFKEMERITNSESGFDLSSIYQLINHFEGDGFLYLCPNLEKGKFQSVS